MEDLFTAVLSPSTSQPPPPPQVPHPQGPGPLPATPGTSMPHPHTGTSLSSLSFLEIAFDIVALESLLMSGNLIRILKLCVGNPMFPRMPMINGMMGPNQRFPTNPGTVPCIPDNFPPLNRMPFADNPR